MGNRAIADPRPPRVDIAAGVAICGFTGMNGAGKTLLAVESALADLRAGRRVFSTVPIRSPWGESEPITSMRHLLGIRDATILLDEVSVLFSSRTTASLSPEAVTYLQVMRHLNVSVRWTAPSWMRCDPILRSVTHALVGVRPLATAPVAGSPWRRPRLLQVGLLDCMSVPLDATPDRVMRRRFVLPRRLAAWGAYDTHAEVPLLEHAAPSGRCPDCGGSRTVPKCSADRHAQLGVPTFDALARNE